jgi:hypothetical protein
MDNTVIEGARPSKFYRIERDRETGVISVRVGVRGPNGTCWKAVAHCNLHSPTGFEIGYGGSGPADTAASILADYFGEGRKLVENAWWGREARPSIAVKLHHNAESGIMPSGHANRTIPRPDVLLPRHKMVTGSKALQESE